MERDNVLRSLKRGLRAVIMLTQHRTLTIAEAARKLELPRTTAERIMATLESEGFVSRDPASKRYRLAARVLALAGGFSTEDWLTEAATPLLFDKTREIGWPLAVAVALGDQMSVRFTSDSATALSLHKRQVGSEVPIAASSGGLVHLAFLEAPQREELIEILLASDDPAQALVKSRPALDAYLNSARQDEYSLGLEVGPERAIAVPLHDRGQIKAVLVMMYMARAVPRHMVINRFVPMLKKLAAQIEDDAFGARSNASVAARH